MIGEVTPAESGLVGLVFRNASEIFNRMEKESKFELEHFWLCCLNTKNRIKKVELVKVGSDTQVDINVGQVFNNARVVEARSVILIHNHPHGYAKPSETDIRTCTDLMVAAKIFKIRLLDFIVIGKFYISMREIGALKELNKLVRIRMKDF